MPVFRFYGHFAAAYGTLWLVMLVYAFLFRTQLDLGLFGLLGFPIIALIYAIVRSVANEDTLADVPFDVPPSGFAVPKGAVPCDAFECQNCNHIARVMTADRACIHCGATRPVMDPA